MEVGSLLFASSRESSYSPITGTYRLTLNVCEGLAFDAHCQWLQQLVSILEKQWDGGKQAFNQDQKGLWNPATSLFHEVLIGISHTVSSQFICL